MRRINIGSPEFFYDGEDPEGFRAGMVQLGSPGRRRGRRGRLAQWVFSVAEYAADPGRVQAVFERFGLPDRLE